MSSWTELLDAHNIPHYGQHHSKMRNAECVVACPLCGDDPSAHLNLFPDGSWYCLRNAEHNGRTARFILHSMGISSSIAFFPVNTQKREKKQIFIKHLQMPGEFKRLRFECAEDPFVEYLVGRGFDLEVLSYLTEQYDLKVAFSGKYAFRIIFPVYCANQLVSWTSRTIGNHPIRYRSLSVREGATMSLTDVLFTPRNYERNSIKKIILMEGPLDAMKLNACRNPELLGISLLGKRLSQAQLMQLIRFRCPVILALDADAVRDAEKMRDRIASQGIDVRVEKIPHELKDVANMTKEEIKCRFA
jgi:5S rRNA maturation endonuclease (ribonuclease M5)